MTSVSLTDTQTEKLMNFIALVGTDDLEKAKEYLKVCEWNLETAADRWWSTNGDVSQLQVGTLNRVSSYDAPVVPMSGSARAFNEGLGGIPGLINSLQNSGQAGQREYLDDPNALNSFGDGEVRSADRAYTEQLLPSNYSAFTRPGYSNSNTKNIGKEWNKGPKTKKSDHLAGLFEDPEYKYSGSWDQAKAEGQKKNKWILLNIQSTDEFASHTLNRDVWKNSETAEIVKSSFLFFQHEKSTDTGRQMCTYYKINEFPHVSVIDPHTGRQECMITVPPAEKFPSEANTVRDKLIEWIEGAPDPTAKKSAKYQPRIKMTPSPQMPIINGDDEELNKALLESLEEDNTSTSVNNNKNKTKSTVEQKSNDVESKEKDKEKEKEKEKTSPIHLDPEPLQTDPEATVLRVRLPDGNVLQRRFKKSALVEQIYRFVELTCSKEHISLVQTMPRLHLNDQKKKTLKELNLDKATLTCSFD